MPAPYRINVPSGIVVVATGEIIHVGEPGWRDYEAWLASGPNMIPDAYVEPVQPVAQQRVEMRARLSAQLQAQDVSNIIHAAGRAWRGNSVSMFVYMLQAMRSPPFGSLRMPDADGVFHNVTKNDLQAIIDACANYHRDLLTWAESKRATIDTTPTPFAVPLNDYPTPP